MSVAGFRASPKKRNRDPSRNTHIEKGAQVIGNDVTPHAREKCGKCRGKGLRFSFERRRNEACACATKRFLEAHPEVIVEKNGALWWPAKQPAVELEPKGDAT